MGVITDQIVEFMMRERLGFVATVTPDNKPNVSPKGSIIPIDSDRLAFADLKSPHTISNLESNPAIEVSVASPIIRRGYMLRGEGRVLREGKEFDDVVAKLREAGIKSAINVVVVIDIDHAEEVMSPLYDLGYTEEQLKETWKRHYFPE